jgi:hypothetical protein
MLTNRRIVPFALAFAFVIFALAYFAVTVRAEVNFSEATQTQNYQTFTFFSATTTTATSTNLVGGGGFFKIAGAKKVELYFSRSATSTNVGASKFRVQITSDGTNWFDYSKLVGSDVSATATSTVTITAATSTTVVNMDILKDTFYGVRCVVDQSVDGAHTCKAAAEF